MRYFSLFGYRYQEVPLTCRQQLLVLSENHSVGLQNLCRRLLDKCHIHFATSHIEHGVGQPLGEIGVCPCPVENVVDSSIVNAKTSIVKVFRDELGIDVTVEFLEGDKPSW